MWILPQDTHMCRYATSGPYKRHFACFHCRKAFKQPPIEDYLAVQGLGYAYAELSRVRGNPRWLKRREEELSTSLDELHASYRDSLHRCPECREPMADMALDFKPPRQSDVKAWHTLRGLFRVGHAFHTCGCDGPGWIPKSTADYLIYLTTRKSAYVDRLFQAQQSTQLDSEQKYEVCEYWRRLIAVLDAEITSLD